MANEAKKGIVRSKAYYVNAIVGVVLMFGIGFIPPVEPITEMGMKVLGIFIGMIYLFSACDVHWPLWATARWGRRRRAVWATRWCSRAPRRILWPAP